MPRSICRRKVRKLYTQVLLSLISDTVALFGSAVVFLATTSCRSYKTKLLGLLTRKGVYLYNWMDNAEKMEETSLPPKEAFTTNSAIQKSAMKIMNMLNGSDSLSRLLWTVPENWCVVVGWHIRIIQNAESGILQAWSCALSNCSCTGFGCNAEDDWCDAGIVIRRKEGHFPYDWRWHLWRCLDSSETPCRIKWKQHADIWMQTISTDGKGHSQCSMVVSSSLHKKKSETQTSTLCWQDPMNILVKFSKSMWNIQSSYTVIMQIYR